jgi:hypothetical protein
VSHLCHQNTVRPQGRPTFVLADLLDPGEGIYLHQRVRDANDMHHVHDTLKSMNEHRGKQGGMRQRIRFAPTQQVTHLNRGSAGRNGPESFAEALKVTHERRTLMGQVQSSTLFCVYLL